MIGSYLLCEVSQFIVKLFEQKIRPWYIFHDWSLSEKESIYHCCGLIIVYSKMASDQKSSDTYLQVIYTTQKSPTD